MNKDYLRKLFNVAMFSNNLPNYDKIRDEDPELFDQHPPKITVDAGFASFIRSRFARAWLAKQRVKKFNITSSNGNIIVDGMNGSVYTRDQDKAYDVFWNEFPKLISTYQNTLYGNDRVKIGFSRGPKPKMFADMVELKFSNVHKHGQTTRYSNEYHISFHRISVRHCSNEEYKRVFDVIAGALEMSGLKLVTKYFDPSQDNEIRFDINEEQFPSIPLMEAELIRSINEVDEQISELTSKKNVLVSTHEGLKAVKQMFRGKTL